LRALAHERLADLRAGGATSVAVRPAADACPVCRAAAGVYVLDALPAIPTAGCGDPRGCRCLYEPAPAGEQPATLAAAAPPPANTLDAAPDTTAGETRERPWYRPRAPRPHGPRWERDLATGTAVPPPPPARPPRRAHGPRKRST
jgi:hypothetical protein